MDSDSEGQENQGVLVREEGTVMMDMILATIVGVLAVLLLVGVPIIVLQMILNGVFIDMNIEDNINPNNEEENGNN